jgi:hypothetical protein
MLPYKFHIANYDDLAITLITVTNSLVAEPDSSTPLIPKPAIGHDPEPVPFIYICLLC